jgi:hypothetical protein
MSNISVKVPQTFLSRVGRSLLATAAFTLIATTAADAKPGWHPVVIRGAGTADPANLTLAYDATFPDGSLQPSVDLLGVNAMQLGDTLVAGSNPTFSALPGELLVSITRPVDLSPDLIVSESAWATPVNFGPGSVSRVSVTLRAPVGPIPGGGFAMGLVAKTGGKDDLVDDTRIAVTVNVRPGFLVRLNVPFGSVNPTNMVLPQEVKDAIFGSPPKPFTLSLTIDRMNGTGKAALKVGDKMYPLTFVLSDFLAASGPPITAMGAGISVNANGPGQTASVHIRDFRIYTSAGG